MQPRLLAAVAFIFGLGVVGCDDPEVQDKVESMLLNGSVQAQASCHMPSNENACSNTSHVRINFKATKFQDGSTLFVVHSDYDSRLFSATDFFKRGDDVISLRFNYAPDDNEYVFLEEGQVSVRGYCSSLSAYQTKVLDLDNDMTCTGFNLETFGIDP